MHLDGVADGSTPSLLRLEIVALTFSRKVALEMVKRDGTIGGERIVIKVHLRLLMGGYLAHVCGDCSASCRHANPKRFPTFPNCLHAEGTWSVCWMASCGNITLNHYPLCITLYLGCNGLAYCLRYPHGR